MESSSCCVEMLWCPPTAKGGAVNFKCLAAENTGFVNVAV